MKPIVNIVEYGVAEILVPHLERRVHVCKTLEDALAFGGQPCSDTDCSGFDGLTVFDTEKGCKVALWFAGKSPDPSTIAHECLHAVNILHGDVGINADRYNDETDAYMLGYLVDGVYSALRMLNKQENNQ